MPSLNSAEARRSARNLYGRETGNHLLATIGEWHEQATYELGLNSLGKVDIEFGPQKVRPHAYFDPDTKHISFGTPLELTPNGIDRLVPAFMVHENAHRRRDEAIEFPDGYDDYRAYLFNGVIDEGLAGLAESIVLEIDPINSFSVAEESDQGLIDILLLDLLFYARPGSPKIGEVKFDRYLNGAPGRLPERGYKIGHYIAARACLLNNMSIQEALGTPDEFYREFAEEYL